MSVRLVILAFTTRLAAVGFFVVALAGCGSNVQTGAGAGGGPATTTSTGTTGPATTATGPGVGGASTTSTGMGGAPTTSTVASTSSGPGGGAGNGGCGGCGFNCCGSTCVNKLDDIHNCGGCGVKCNGSNPFCNSGVCGTPPCSGPACAPGGACCGNACCNAGELCCDIPGPVETGPRCTQPTTGGTCPLGCNGCKCASPDTPIATPSGERPIASLREGDLVYSVDHGRVVAVPVLRTTSVEAKDHAVVEVTLAGGRVLTISPRHPTADGRSFGDLRAGGTLDGVAIRGARLVPYPHDRTYDILPSSDTGTYFAGGVLIGSTLADSGAVVSDPTAPTSSSR